MAFDSAGLEKFSRESPFIESLQDQARSDVFCNDAFEIGWIVEKANRMFDQITKFAGDWSMINHAKIMKDDHSNIITDNLDNQRSD